MITKILLWNVQIDIFSNQIIKASCLKTEHNSNIFCLAWDNENERIFSGSNDHTVIVHDVQT